MLHVLESIERIEKYTRNMGSEFMENVQVQDAVIRRLEMISETVKNIPKDFRERYSQIPWKQIAGTRDILVVRDLPKLKERIEKILEDIVGMDWKE